MRRIYCLALLTFAFAFQSRAQSPTTTLRLILNPLLSIAVNQATTDITFATLSDYQNGKSTDQASHLTITYVGASTYTVKVAASAANFAGVTSGNTSTIPVGSVQVSVDGGAASVGTGASVSTVTLSTTATTLIATGPPALAKNLGVTYTVPAAAAQNLIALTPDTYTTTVTYTISTP
ncbi:MAG: hypothetical protein JST68_05100 [Bacteroidetes bacterium]|nr:hypothetical protein [Bacteroidota bacterium]